MEERKMERAVIFGAGGTGKKVYDIAKNQYEIVAFVDNNSKKWGESWCDLEIKKPEWLKEEKEYDVILLGTLMGSSEIQLFLKNNGISINKLKKTYVELPTTARLLFLKRFSQIVSKKESLSVAECGVYNGEFAKEINRCFPEQKCYLFDTFEGFDERDIKLEQGNGSKINVHHFTKVDEKTVFEKMPYKDKVIIKKGYFPETAIGLEEEFIFVNLDMDLYNPTLEGLRYFYPRMKRYGVILIHDFFSDMFPNVKRAVEQYESETGEVLYKMPIGDDISLAIIKS